MADPNIITLTIPETRALADRLFNRGISKMGTDTPEQARDLRLAARVIWVLCLEVDLNGPSALTALKPGLRPPCDGGHLTSDNSRSR
jgi:hypothetical protein